MTAIEINSCRADGIGPAGMWLESKAVQSAGAEPPRDLKDLEFRERIPDDLVKVGEACEILGVCRETVWRWVRAERLPCFRVGRRLRFSRAELVALIERL